MSEMSSVFEARWPTDCAACGWRIVRGTLAKYAGDEVVHAVCPESEPLRAVGEICPSCFIEKSVNGTCGCP